MRLTRRQVGLGAALAGMAPGAVRAETRVQFPFRLTRNRPWTGVSLNKKPAQPFMLDMGSSGFVVDNAYARAIGLSRLGDQAPALTPGGPARLDLYGVNELVIGGALRETDLTMAGWTQPPGALVQGLIPVAQVGCIGFDFEAQTITCDSAPGLPPADYDHIPLSRPRGLASGSGEIDTPVLIGHLDGRELRLVVDTGASGGLFLLPSVVRATGLWDRAGGTFLSRQSHTLAGAVAVRQIRSGVLSFGRFRFERPLIDLLDPTSAGRLPGEADGMVGIELLRRLNFVLNMERHGLWVKPNRFMDDVYRYNRSGLSVETSGPDVRVQTAEGPAARAGLVVGQRVTGWAGEGGVFGLEWALQGPPGAVVRVQVDRAGTPTPVDITLEEPAWAI